MNLILQRIRSFYFKKSINRNKIDAPKVILSDIWRGNPNLGSKISNSKNPINEIINLDTFNFVRDLKSFGTLKSRSTSRKIINYWIDLNTNLFSKSYNYNVNAKRICVMCLTYSWFASSGEQLFQKKILNFIYTQLKLQEIFFKRKKYNYNFKVIKSLIIGNIFLFNDYEKINNYLTNLNNLSKKLILSDGGHISRCPNEQLDCLRDIMEIRACVASIKKIDTVALHNLAKKMSDYFKIFCVTKNTFCSFNSGSLISKKVLSETLKRLTSSKNNFVIANASGYAYISSNKLDVVIDTGNKNLLSSNFLKKNKASITAFELFYSKYKILSNVGTPYYDQSNEIKFRAIASTAAHNTLSIDNINNLDLDKRRELSHVKVKSSENSQGYLIDIQHDGYQNTFGVIHSRILFISKEEQDLRGEDIILSHGNIKVIPKMATLRFHLYHNIKPIKLQNGNILLQNVNNKVVGTFYSNIKSTSVQDTIIYEENKKFRSNQIIIEVPINEIRKVKKIIIKWSFKFEKIT